LAVGHRVVVMRGGAIEQVGTPQVVFEHPATRFVASFLDEPAFLPTCLHQGRLICEIGAVPTCRSWAADSNAEVALRPHEVTIHPDPRASAQVSAVEYHGAFMLHHIRLPSGRTVSSWQPHTVRHPIGTPVTVTITAGTTPPVFGSDTTLTGPPG
jgi:iron(III) transport system ATP-binding protein